MPVSRTVCALALAALGAATVRAAHEMAVNPDGSTGTPPPPATRVNVRWWGRGGCTGLVTDVNLPAGTCSLVPTEPRQAYIATCTDTGVKLDFYSTPTCDAESNVASTTLGPTSCAANPPQYGALSVAARCNVPLGDDSDAGAGDSSDDGSDDSTDGSSDPRAVIRWYGDDGCQGSVTRVTLPVDVCHVVPGLEDINAAPRGYHVQCTSATSGIIHHCDTPTCQNCPVTTTFNNEDSGFSCLPNPAIYGSKSVTLDCSHFNGGNQGGGGSNNQQGGSNNNQQQGGGNNQQQGGGNNQQQGGSNNNQQQGGGNNNQQQGGGNNQQQGGGNNNQQQGGGNNQQQGGGNNNQQQGGGNNQQQGGGNNNQQQGGGNNQQQGGGGNNQQQGGGNNQQGNSQQQGGASGAQNGDGGAGGGDDDEFADEGAGPRATIRWWGREGCRGSWTLVDTPQLQCNVVPSSPTQGYMAVCDESGVGRIRFCDSATCASCFDSVPFTNADDGGLTCAPNPERFGARSVQMVCNGSGGSV